MDISDVRRAQELIRPYVRRTPFERSESLSRRLSTNIFVKYELFQRTGSFKSRGAFNKILSLSNDTRSNGIVAVSGGNHAQAVAYAASVLGVRSVIVMPESTPQNYLDATRGYGATVDLEPTIAAAFDKVAEYQAEGMAFVHPFDDDQVMAGQGTLGLEIMEDLPEVTDVVVSIGGGGLAGGVSTAIKSVDSSVRIWGVETEGADAMSQALKAGRPVTLPAITSIAKTLGAPSVSDKTFMLAQTLLESVTVITDREAVESLVYIAEKLKVLTEPAASCTLAAAERLRDNFTDKSNVVLIFCGGNQSIKDVCRYLSLV